MGGKQNNNRVYTLYTSAGTSPPSKGMYVNDVDDDGSVRSDGEKKKYRLDRARAKTGRFDFGT